MSQDKVYHHELTPDEIRRKHCCKQPRLPGHEIEARIIQISAAIDYEESKPHRLKSHDGLKRLRRLRAKWRMYQRLPGRPIPTHIYSPLIIGCFVCPSATDDSIPPLIDNPPDPVPGPFTYFTATTIASNERNKPCSTANATSASPSTKPSTLPAHKRRYRSGTKQTRSHRPS